MSRFVAWMLLSGMLGLFSLNSAQAGVDFGLGILKRMSKPDAAARAKLVITTLLTDPDEKKRKGAAEELRGYDPRNIPEVIPALVASLQKDPVPAVRIEAVESIGRLKPIAQTAGLAMESALQTDPDPKVRDAIRAALFQYQINGYRTPPTGANGPAQSSEPRLATKPSTTPTKPATPGSQPEAFRPITNSVGKAGPFPQSAEPPLAKPKTTELPKPVTVEKPKEDAKPSTPLPSPTPAPSRSVPQQMPSTPVPVPTTPLPEIKIPAAPATPALPTIPVPSVPVPPKN